MASSNGGKVAPRKLTFRYPTAPPAIQVVCWALMLVVFCVGYWGDVPLKGAWSLAAVSVFWLVAGGGGIVPWVMSLWRRSNRVALDENGIAVGRRFVAWADITQIGHPRFFMLRRTLVRIRDSSPTVGFFDLRASFTGRGRPVYLWGYPFVYRDVLPAILAVRPDLQVPPLIRRMMDDPERAMEPNAWLVLATLGVAGALLTAAAKTYGHSVSRHLMIAIALCSLPGMLRALAVLWIKDARAALVGAALSSPLLVGAAMFMVFFGMGNYAGLQALIATSLAMVLGAAVAFFLMDDFKAGYQTGLAVLLLAVPAAVYGGIRSGEWPGTEVSIWLDELPSVMWGEDGVHATVRRCDDPPPVLHVPSMEEVKVPGHGGDSITCWLGKRHLLRRVEAAGGDGLWAFDLERKAESRLPAAENWRVGHLQPLDAQGRRLVWLDCDADWQAQSVRTWNLATHREERPPIALPVDTRNEYCSADWIDADNVAVHWRDGNGSLHVLRLSLRTGKGEAWTSAHWFDAWIPIEGLDHAFGVTEQGWDAGFLTSVDLKTDRAVALDGIGGYPGVAPDAGCSFRVRSLRGKRMLCRFDFATTQETTICRVPSHLALAGVCRSGRTVVLGPAESLGSMPEYLVVDVRTRKKHTIRLSGMVVSSRGEYLSGLPGEPPLSPDGLRVIFSTLRPMSQSGRVLLYAIPPNWP